MVSNEEIYHFKAKGMINSQGVFVITIELKGNGIYSLFTQMLNPREHELALIALFAIFLYYTRRIE